MSEERERILRMVEAGTISAGEAHELLSALEGEGQAGEVPASPPTELERPWEVPFLGGLVITALGLIGLGRAVGWEKRPGLLARLGAFSTLLIGVMAMLVGFFGRDAPWLHVQIQEAGEVALKISLPLPIFLADWFIGLARGFADEETVGYLDGASEFLAAMRSGEDSDPFSVEVDEGDDRKVLVYIG